jgi:hypothetical protein
MLPGHSGYSLLVRGIIDQAELGDDHVAALDAGDELAMTRAMIGILLTSGIKPKTVQCVRVF